MAMGTGIAVRDEPQEPKARFDTWSNLVRGSEGSLLPMIPVATTSWSFDNIIIPSFQWNGFQEA